MKVLVTGATGLIGRKLICHLLARGHEVRALARHPERVSELPETEVFAWNDREIAPSAAFAGMDAVIHLAGEPIAEGKWTPERKRQLADSRIRGTRNLLLGIGIVDPRIRPQIFLSASAIGFYGDTGEKAVDESAVPGSDFLADLCRKWEEASAKAGELGIRTASLRFGIVLAKEGGALAKMGPVVLGSGQQWMSWIHIQDLVRFIEFALTAPGISGSYNLVSPEPARNREFTRELASALGFPFVLPAPAFALRLVLGELADALLGSQRVFPARAVKAGFTFQFSSLKAALGDLYSGCNFLDSFHVAHQFVPVPLERVFPFFAKAENLETITPPWLNFRITKKSSAEITKDSLIDYRLRIHGVPTRWRTLISEWNPPQSFVDDQLRGPYRRWHHVHTFTSVPGGTLLSDEVTFRVPGWALGKLLLTRWIRRDVNTIFSFRRQKIRELVKNGEL